jgi:hypothetical protein
VLLLATQFFGSSLAAAGSPVGGAMNWIELPDDPITGQGAAVS